MFRTRVFGGTPDAFQLACEYGPSHVRGNGKIPTPEALKSFTLDWTSAESETQVLERFAQRQSALLLEQTEERVSLQLSWEPIADASAFPNQHLTVKLCITSQAPVLRSLHFTRTAGSGCAPESLMTTLLQHMDLSTVWKLRVSEGFPAHFWASCTEAHQWHSLFNLNLSSSGLTSLPSAIGQLASLHVLRLNHNKLTSLPQELGHLSELEVLSVNHNQLTTLPAELRRCSSLRELHLEFNRLVTPLLDLTHATALESLQLYGNPLEYLPELAPAVGLRSLSLANVRIMADAAYTRWEVEVTAPSSSYTSMVMGGRNHKLQPLFNLVCRRSSVQHPLLAGAMSRLMEDPTNLELLVREDVALQQLVLASMGSNPLVVQQAVKIMSAVGAYAGAAKRLVKHNVVRAISGMVASGDKSLQLSGLRVLSSLAAGAAEGELHGEVLVPTALLDRLLALIRAPETHQEVRCAVLHALGNSAFDASNRRRYLQSPGLMQLLVMLAAAPDTPAPPPSPPPPAASERGQAQASPCASDGSPAACGPSQSVQQRQEAEAEDSPAEDMHERSRQQQEAAGGSSSAEAAATQPAQDSGPPPLAPNPHIGQSGAAAEQAASFSPPLLTMSRAPSSTGKTAAPAGEQTGSAAKDVLVLAHSSSGPGQPLGRSTSGGQAAEAAASSSEASGLSGPSTAMAAAAGAAAVAAAAHAAAPGDATGETAAGSSAAAGGAGGKKVAAGGSASSVVAAADAILPKKRLVAVNNPVKLQAIRLLGILGQNEQVRIALGQPPIRGRGLRVLAMDGGGMKGMAMVELLRQLERRAGAPIWTLFDVIGGTSTGGLLAVSLGLLRLNLDACQEIYTSLGNKVFNQSSAVQEDAGWRDNLYRMYTTSSANMRVAVYGSKHDAANYEELLRRFCAVTELGCASDRLIDTAVMGGPKVFVVATLASSRPAAPFAFRNYELPDEATPIAQQLAACAGSCKHHVWEAVRASSAAPYYLDDFLTADGKRFQDGATTANNPTVIALQQARLLHPQLPIDCVVSLGCGSEPFSERSKGLSSVIDTGAVLLESACSTDRVHEALATTLQLVPGCQYFRFCAIDPRCNMELDDIRQESWSRLMTATSDYCSQPQVAAQFDRLAALLKRGGNAAPGVGSSAGQEAHVGGSSSSPARPQPHVTGWHASSKPHKAAPGQADTEQQQQQARQASANPLLLGGSLLRDLACTSSLQHTSLSGLAAEENIPLQGLQQARAAGAHTSAPRLLYQRGLLLVQARREVAAPAAAAAAAQGVSLASLQQQEFVAQLLAAALPQDLVHTCDLAAASAAAAADFAAAPAANRAAWEEQSPYRRHAAAQKQLTQQQQQQRQHLRVAADAGKAIHGTELHSTETSPRHIVSRHASIGSSHLHSGSAAAAAVAQRLQQHGGSDAGERHKADRPQRASDTGVLSLSSPKPASWLEYIFPWQGAASAGSSPRQQQPPDSSQQAGSGEAAAAAAVGIVPAAGGAWSSASPCDGSSPGSPRKAVSQVQEAHMRATVAAKPASGNNMQAVQSSPNLLPGSITQQQQQQEVTPGGALLKIKSLPAQYLSPQQQQQQQATNGVIRSSSYSPSLPTLPGSSGGGSHISRIANTGCSQPGHNAHGSGAHGGSSAGQQQQQQHAAAGSAAVSEALRQQLLSAAGRVGVVHLALHATEAGLVAGWQQQLTAVVEPGPEVSQLLDFLTDSCSADSTTHGHTLAQLVSSQGPVLSGPQGALVAVLAQQQVLAPVPASSNPATAAAAGGLGQLGPAQQMTQFVTSWLLQLTLPDSSRLLGVKQVWPLLSQLQQLIIVSSSWLPPTVVHVLLRGGVSAVVCGADAAEVAAVDAADVAEFFRVFYVEGLWAGLDVVEALQSAIAAVPSVGDTTYECYQLM